MAGLLLGLCIFMPFYLATGMGAGDVKLMGAVGVFLGPIGVFMAFLATAVVGGIYAIILIAMHGFLKETVKRYGAMLKTFFYTQSFIYIPPEKAEEMPVMAYGVAIAIGTSLSVYFKGVI
jgi:prepilin peptidase CpaA